VYKLSISLFVTLYKLLSKIFREAGTGIKIINQHFCIAAGEAVSAACLAGQAQSLASRHGSGREQVEKVNSSPCIPFF
jgi:hypothetical protein